MNIPDKTIQNTATKITNRASDKGGRGPTPKDERCSVVFTAAKRQAPQHIWPHGVIVALVGGEKQIGHVYDDSGSAGGFCRLPVCTCSVSAVAAMEVLCLSDGGESLISMMDWSKTGVCARALPFPLRSMELLCCEEGPAELRAIQRKGQRM